VLRGNSHRNEPFLTGAFLAAFLATAIPFCQAFRQAKSSGIVQLQQQAAVAAAAGDVPGALAKCDQILADDPHNLRAALLKAEILQEAGRYPDAITVYRSVLREHPTNEPAVVGLSSAYRKVFNYDEAERTLQKFVAAQPRSVLARLSLAELHLQLQQFEKASDELKRLLQSQPGNAKAHLDLGIANQSLGKNEAALAEFNTAIKHDPKLISAYYFRGSYRADQNDNAGAAADAQRVLKSEPANRRASVLLAKVDLRVSNCADAVKLLIPVTEAEKDNSEAFFLLARAYDCNHQPDLAKATRMQFDRISHEKEARSSAENDANHLVEQAAHAAREDQLSPAMDLLKQALAKDPENAAAHSLMAKIAFSRGQTDKALEEINISLKSKPFHPDYLYVLGKILEKQGDYQGALAAFQKTTLVNPKEADAYFEMSQIYAQTDKPADATRAIRKAVELAPDDADYKRALTAIESKAPASK